MEISKNIFCYTCYFCTLVQSAKFTHKLILACKRTHTHTYPHTNEQTHTQAHTNKHTHTYTYTQTYFRDFDHLLDTKTLILCHNHTHTTLTHNKLISGTKMKVLNGKEFHRKSSNLSFVDKSFNLLKFYIWIPRPNKQVDSYKISASLLMIVILVEEEFGSSMFHGRIVLLRSI